MDKAKKQPKRKRDDKPRSKERIEDLPLKDDKAAGVKGGYMKGLVANHNETLVGV